MFKPTKPIDNVLVFPTEYVSITQYYKPSHLAIDISNGSADGKYKNKYIYASADGKVTYNGYASDAGYYLDILFDNGFKMRHCHFKKKPSLKVGQRVSFWQVLGEMGTTGTSNGVHDHCMLWKGNTRVNPCDYLVRLEGQPTHKDELKTIKLYKPADLPKPVPRNTSVDQFEVLTNSLRCRDKAGLDATVLGLMPKGIYNLLDTVEKDGYIWLMAEDNKWCAKFGNDVKVYPKESSYKEKYDKEVKKNVLLIKENEHLMAVIAEAEDVLKKG